MKTYMINGKSYQVNEEVYNFNSHAVMNEDMRLCELKKMVRKANGHAHVPGCVSLRSNEVLVAAVSLEDTRIEVYENGFMVYETPSGNTVLEFSRVGRASYSSVASYTTQRIDLDNVSWAVAATIAGEERREYWAQKAQGKNEVSTSYGGVETEDGTYTDMELDAGVNVEQQVFTEDFRNQIMEILSERQRQIFTLRYKMGYEQERIARMLGVTQTSVEVQLSRAIKKIKMAYCTK